MEGCPYDYKGNQFDEVWQIKYVYRSFRHTTDNHGGVKETGKHWDVFGSVQHEQFDPLAFSKTVGDYPHQGTDQGARWKPSEIALYD